MLSGTHKRLHADSGAPERVFAALADATRLSLLAKLADGQQHSISELTAGTKLTRQAITKHLRVLHGAGMVRCSRAGRESLFEFEVKTLDAARKYLDLVSGQWELTLNRLKVFVEEGSPQQLQPKLDLPRRGRSTGNRTRRAGHS